MLLPALLVALLVAASAASAAGPPLQRPFSGCGVLALAPPPAAGGTALVLYREPGVERVVETDPSRLPRIAGSPAEPLVPVSARRGEWTLLSYDDAGRTGWVEQARSWQFLSWDEFLPGRLVRVLPGLQKGYYALKSEPGERGAQQGALYREQAVRVVRTEEDWALLEAPAGWFRWRDPDGRLTISLQDPQ